jgi:hypothetical protein
VCDLTVISPTSYIVAPPDGLLSVGAIRSLLDIQGDRATKSLLRC